MSLCWYRNDEMLIRYDETCPSILSSLIGESTGPAAEEVCSIEIPMYGIFVNVFTAVEELWEGVETAKGLTCVAFHYCFMLLSSARRAWEESIYLYTPGHLG